MPQVGDFMVTATHGWVAKAIQVISKSTVNHAAVYVGGGWIVEAQPGGAKLSPVKNYPDAIWANWPLSWDQGQKVAHAAEGFVKTPYNFLDIAAQGVVRVFGWHAPSWALKRLSTTDRLQCAQLVDAAYEAVGIKLFKDGRPEGMVSPGDLLDLIQKASVK